MLVGPAERAMAGALAAAGFDEASPDPAVAWGAFLAFVATPLFNVTTVNVGYECFNLADADEVLWLTFERSLEIGWGCDCVFSRPVTPELIAVAASDWWWPERDTLAGWARRVEQCPAFRACLRLGGWRWEGFSA